MSGTDNPTTPGTTGTGVMITAIGSGAAGNNPARVFPPGGPVRVKVPEDAHTAIVEAQGAMPNADGWVVVAFYRADGSLFERIAATREAISGKQ